MLHRVSDMARLAAAFAAAWLAIVAGTAFAAPADDLKEAQKLYGQGKLEPALEKDEAYLKAEPRDPQGRFLKGLILTEQKKTQEAIQVFQGLTEDFPELPEPYNNLAVLYASQGNYEKAKSALELAIHTHPTYATAHENLGDIYAELASRAYDRALQLDKNNTTAKVKLAMVKDLFSAQKLATRAQSVGPGPSSGTEAPKGEAAKPAPAKAQAPSAGAELPAAKSGTQARSEPQRTAQVTAAPRKATAAPKPQSSGADANAQVAAAVAEWARAWSAKDVKGYLAHYAPDFELPKGTTREAWEKQRAERIERPKSIDVQAKIISARVDGDEAIVKIRQSYRSDSLKSHSTKTLRLEKSGERWLIKQERIGG
ncbi:MAG TPA: tetratricopeptide repeat protein [Usitatibacter sp.]|nr:tetratricopeptide repeat protein [Usitatibacter sp.]